MDTIYRAKPYIPEEYNSFNTKRLKTDEVIKVLKKSKHVRNIFLND